MIMFRVAAVAVLALFLPMAASAQPADRLDIAIDFTPAARAKLERLHEKVIVAAYFYGEPTQAGKAMADKTGQVDLGIDRLEIAPVDQSVTVTGRRIKRGWLRFVEGGRAHVLINVFSARHSDPDNLLNCDIFEDVFGAPAASPHLHCELIYPDAP